MTVMTRTSVLPAASAAMLVSYLPFSAVNGSLGTIEAATGASTAGLQWASDAFAAALASVVLVAGALGARYGHRSVAVAGLLLTALGTLLSDLAGVAGLPALWAGQALAGVGAGLVMSATLALVSATAVDRSRSIALWAGALVLGLGGGPFVAAAALAVAPWWTMFAPVAIAAVASAAWLRVVAPRSAAQASSAIDRPGIALAVAAVATLTVAIIELATLPAIAAGLLLVAFVVRERRASLPMLDLSLFGRPAFNAAGLAAAAVLFAIAGMVFVLGLFFASAQGASPLHVALLLGVLFAANASGGPVAARIQQRAVARVPLLLGLVLAATGALGLLTLTPETGAVGTATPLVVLGFGAGLVMSTASTVAVSAAAAQTAAMAGAANNALRQLGATLGPAVLGGAVAARPDLTSTLHAAALIAALVLLAAAATGALLLYTPNKEPLT